MTSDLPEIVRDLQGLRQRVADWKRAGDKVAVVPTMGRTFANLLRQRNSLPWLLLGVALQPLQLAGEWLWREPSALQAVARKPL